MVAVAATNTMMMVAVAPSTTSATPPFILNSTVSTFVEWKIGPVDAHSDSGIEASAEAFVADKVSRAWNIHHKR